MTNIAENISAIKAKITKYDSSAKLIAVSKNHTEAAVREALTAGQRIFGENRVQEAAGKFPQLRGEYPDLELHLIGPLQTNKVKEAVNIFDIIQTVDREKLALVLAKEKGRCSEFFIQVNIGEEEQKAGIAPKEAEQFYNFCRNDLKLNVTGLMCIPPAEEPAFMYFALLGNIAKKLGTSPKLSMGMSGDFEEALELCANYVRVGTAIFGERQKL